MVSAYRFGSAEFSRNAVKIVSLLLIGLASCSDDSSGGTPDSGSSTPDGGDGALRGGALYDNLVTVLKLTPPTADHPLWATRPDMMTNTLKGADTWRCKECHGWDYKGAAGAYATGSHKTGFAGIIGTTKTEAEIVDSLKNKHGYSMLGVSDAAISDLAKFVKQDLIDTSSIVESNKAFKGDAAKGKMLYAGTCQTCHLENGLNEKPTGSAGMFDEFPGKIASDNPWEFTHKVRFGQPGYEMPPQARVLTLAQLGDLGAHAQTLPKAPTAP